MPEETEFDLAAEDVQRLLATLRKKTGNLAPALREIGEMLVSSIQRNFTVGGRYGPGPFGGGLSRWRPSGRAVRESGVTLSDTGQLAASITARPVGEAGLLIGTNKVYGAIHQYGGRAGRAGSALIPARPFIVIQKEDLQEVADIIGDYLSAR